MLTLIKAPLVQRPSFRNLSAFLLASLFLSSEPAHAFGKKPVVVPNNPSTSTPATPPTEPKDVIRARWEPKNRDGVIWSQHVYDALPRLAPNLLKKQASDIASFCPAYSELKENDQKNFWVYLFSAMSELESGHDPNNTYKENFKDPQGNYVMSVGLLQLSIGDAKIYGCDFKTDADLVDPIKNLDCGMRIMNKWVGADGLIQGYAARWLGGARYWSVLRAPKVTRIQAWTKALPMCGK